MNKNILIGIVVVLVIVLVGWIIYSGKISTEYMAGTEQNNSNTTTTGGVANNTNTFKSIFNQPGSHTCTFEKVQVSPSSKASNAIFVADGKMRGEFRSTVGTKTTLSMMVYNNGILYLWTEGMGVGTKKPLNSVSELPYVIPTDLTSGKILGSSSDNVSWDCHDWIKVDSLLSPPTTVKFY